MESDILGESSKICLPAASEVMLWERDSARETTKKRRQKRSQQRVKGEKKAIVRL